MKAIILAAGKGKRMFPLTLKKPKPMLRVNKKPILQFTLDQLEGLVDEAIIVIGYKGNQIKDYFGNSYKNIKLRYSFQEKPLGCGHALQQVKNVNMDVKGKFISLMGDDLYSKKDIKECLKYKLSVLAKKVNNPEKFGVLKVENGKIIDFIEKPKKFLSNLVSTGLWIFDDRAFNFKLKKSERDEFEIVDIAKQYLKIGENINIVEVKDFWIPISCKEDLDFATKFLKEREIR